MINAHDRYKYTSLLVDRKTVLYSRPPIQTITGKCLLYKINYVYVTEPPPPPQNNFVALFWCIGIESHTYNSCISTEEVYARVNRVTSCLDLCTIFLHIALRCRCLFACLESLPILSAANQYAKIYTLAG